VRGKAVVDIDSAPAKVRKRADTKGGKGRNRNRPSEGKEVLQNRPKANRPAQGNDKRVGKARSKDTSSIVARISNRHAGATADFARLAIGSRTRYRKRQYQKEGSPTINERPR